MNETTLPAVYPEFRDDDDDEGTSFENTSFSKLTELPNCTALQRSLIPKHLLDDKKEPVRSSWIPNLGISDALQKAKERGEQITNERRIAQGLPPLSSISKHGTSRHGAMSLQANGASTYSSVSFRAKANQLPLDEPITPSPWKTRSTTELSNASTDDVVPEADDISIGSSKEPEAQPEVKPTPRGFFAMRQTNTSTDKDTPHTEVPSEGKMESNEPDLELEVKSDVKPKARGFFTWTTAKQPEITVGKNEELESSDTNSEGNEMNTVVIPNNNEKVEHLTDNDEGEVQSNEHGVRTADTKKNSSLESTNAGLAGETPKKALKVASRKSFGDETNSASNELSEALQLASSGLGATQDEDSEDDMSADRSLQGNGGRLSVLLRVGQMAQPTQDLDDMSYGTTHTSQPVGDRRANFLHTSMLSVQELNLAPDEVEVKERRPWRRQSELRRGSIMTGRRSTVGGAMASAAAAVAAQFGDSDDSDDPSVPQMTLRGALLPVEYEDDEIDTSTNSDVLYELPTGFDRGLAPPTNFLDAWQADQKAQKAEDAVDHMQSIWGQGAVIVEEDESFDPDLSFFVPVSFPDVALESNDVDKSTEEKPTKTNETDADALMFSMHSRCSTDPTIVSDNRKNRNGKKDAMVDQPKHKSGNSMDILVPAKGTKSKNKNTESTSEHESTEKKKIKKKKSEVVNYEVEDIANADVDNTNYLPIDDKIQPSSTTFGNVNKWPALKEPGRLQKNSTLENVQLAKPSSSSDIQQQLSRQIVVKQTSIVSQSSNGTAPSTAGSEKTTTNMLDHLEQQSRATTMTSLFDNKQLTWDNNDQNALILGSKSTTTVIRMSSSRHLPHSLESKSLEPIMQEALHVEGTDKLHQHGKTTVIQRGRGLFGFGKKKQNEHVSLDDEDGAAVEACNGSGNNFDKPIAPSGGFRRRMSGGGTMPTNITKLGFGARKSLEDIPVDNKEDILQPLRRSNFGGGIQRQAPKSKTDSQPLMLDRQTSGNWGNVNLMHSPPSGMKGKMKIGLETIDDNYITQAFDDGFSLTTDDHQFRAWGPENDVESDFNPRGDPTLKARTAPPAAIVHRTSSAPSPRINNGNQRDESALIGDLFFDREKGTSNNVEKPSKPPRRKSVSSELVPERTYVGKKEKKSLRSSQSKDEEIDSMLKESRHDAITTDDDDDDIDTPISEKKKKKKDSHQDALSTHDDKVNTSTSQKTKTKKKTSHKDAVTKDDDNDIDRPIPEKKKSKCASRRDSVNADGDDEVDSSASAKKKKMTKVFQRNALTTDNDADIDIPTTEKKNKQKNAYYRDAMTTNNDTFDTMISDKKKKKKSSFRDAGTTDDDDEIEAIVPKRKTKMKTSNRDAGTTDDDDEIEAIVPNRKTKMKTSNRDAGTTDDDDEIEAIVPNRKTKMKTSNRDAGTTDDDDDIETPASEKKKKSIYRDIGTTDDDDIETPVSEKKKKKKSIYRDTGTTDDDVDIEAPVSEKKKKKKSICRDSGTDDHDDIEAPVEKKKKKKSIYREAGTTDDDDIETPVSAMKKKKKSIYRDAGTTDDDDIETPVSEKKQKKKSMYRDAETTDDDDDDIETPVSKKKKKKKSIHRDAGTTDDDDNINEIQVSDRIKKKKSSYRDTATTDDDDEIENPVSEKKKKKKSSNRDAMRTDDDEINILAQEKGKEKNERGLYSATTDDSDKNERRRHVATRGGEFDTSAVETKEKKKKVRN